MMILQTARRVEHFYDEDILREWHIEVYCKEWRGFLRYRLFLDSTMHDLFTKIKAPNHSLFYLLPPRRPLHQTLQEIGHGSDLPSYNYCINSTSSLLSSIYVFYTVLPYPISTIFHSSILLQFHCILISSCIITVCFYFICVVF